ncbi:MAG: DUF2892 domain-containing protein [Saccharospirillaceae bacterium]|nr:sulfurtransferase [Thalassolituus sp. HI0120]MCH2040977.1 DUF2892 domain-containing protein [Saccharospirillaceae bacterium]
MNIDRLIFAIAGLFILMSITLSLFYSSYWLGLSAFVAANMLQAAFTGFCPLASILKRLGIEPGNAFN